MKDRGAVQEGTGEDGVAALLMVNVELLENPLLILEAPLTLINLLTFTEKLTPRQDESYLLVSASNYGISDKVGL